MNENEYKAQKATGVIDYLDAAIQTVSKKVLARIVEDTNDTDVHLAVAVNKFTDARTLTRLIIDRDTTDATLNACIWHPSITVSILTSWMQKSYIEKNLIAQQRLYTLQVVNKIPESDRIKLNMNALEELHSYEIIKKYLDHKSPLPRPSHPWRTDLIGGDITCETTAHYNTDKTDYTCSGMFVYNVDLSADSSDINAMIAYEGAKFDSSD